MFSFEDIIITIILCAAIMIGVSLFVSYLERRQKTALEYERKRNTEESDTVLQKARIYADKDRDVAKLESGILSQLNYSSPEEPDLSSMEGILSFATQNPEIVNNLIEKFKGANK